MPGSKKPKVQVSYISDQADQWVDIPEAGLACATCEKPYPTCEHKDAVKFRPLPGLIWLRVNISEPELESPNS